MLPGWIAPLLLAAAPAPPVADAPGSRPVVAPPRPVAPAETAHTDALARYGAAILQARRDRLLTAARGFETAAKLDPEAAAPLRELVRLYPLVGREPEAIRAARTVLAKDPADGETAHALARLLADAGEFREAADALARAADAPTVRAKPLKALVVLRELATVREKAGDLPAAEAALRRASALLADRKAVAGHFQDHEIDAEAADTLERLGKVLAARRAFDAAADAFRAAADRYRPSDPAAAARLGWNLSGVEAARGNPAAALGHLDAFLRLKPQNLEPYERLVSLLRSAGRGGGAVTQLRTLLQADPKNLPLKAVYAAELLRRGDRAAEPLFAELGRATADPGVVRVLVTARIDAGSPDRVLADLDEAYKATDDKPDPGGPTDPATRALLADRARATADVLKADGRLAEAVFRHAIREAQAGTDRSYQTWHLVGLLAARHRKLDEAEALYRQAIGPAMRPRPGVADDSTAMLGLIRVLWWGKKYAAVADVCRDGIRRAGVRRSPVVFYFHLSLALAELGQRDAALAAAEEAIKPIGGGTDRLTVRLRKATVYKVLGDWPAAVEYCQQLLGECDTAADRAKVRYALAAAYWGAKKPAESEAELRGILEEDPDHAGACNDLGYHLADQGRNLDEAERLVRHAVAIDRAERRRTGDPEAENAAYLDSLGWVLFRRGDPAGAKGWLGKAAEMPDGAADAVVWDHLGDVHFRLGEKDRAKACWETAARLYLTDRRGTAEGRTDEVRRKLKRVP